MKHQYKIVPILYRGNVWYALYQKKRFWGWKYIDRFVYEYRAIEIAQKLSKPIIFVED